MLYCVTYEGTIYKHIRGVNRYVKHISCDMYGVYGYNRKLTYVKHIYVKLIYAICTDYTDNV